MRYSQGTINASNRGNFEINSPVPGQGRTQINNQGVRVYDANNRIRVKLGDLS